MIAWHYVSHFTPQQAALAIIGEPPTDDPKVIANAAPVLAELRRAYEECRQGFALASDGPPKGRAFTLMSDEMRSAQGRTTSELAAVAGDFRFLTWLQTPMADFERQHFSREEVARWLHETGRPSTFFFGRGQGAGQGQVGSCSAEVRQAHRYQMCLDAGLKLPENDYAHLPPGIGKLAKTEKISRQAFAEDVRKHINRLANQKR